MPTDNHMVDAFRFCIGGRVYDIKKLEIEGSLENMNKYKVGDKIVLKKELKNMDKFDDTCFVPKMEKYKTIPLTIIKITEDGLYETKGTKDDDRTWFVRDEMIAEKWDEVMNIGKAIECMKLGMKIRDTSWDDGEYIYYNDENDIIDESGEIYHIDGYDLNNIWVEYKDEEEKPKKDKIDRLGDYKILLDKDQESLVILLRDMKTAINKLIDAHNGEENV